MLRRLSFLGIAVAFGLTFPRRVEACGPPPEKSPIAIPRSGATNVPTIVDLVVLVDFPYEVTLAHGTTSYVLPKPWLVGSGLDSKTGVRANVWRFRLGGLEPSTEYVASMTWHYAPVELTRFTTGTGYDKPTGMAPSIGSLSLTRYRYPVDSIGKGDCVFSEYHGFLTLDWKLGTFPNTPVDSVMHVLSLGPKTGGAGSTFVWFGDAPAEFPAPTGDRPLPTGYWQPDLDPTREQCLVITAHGYGEATMPTGSGPTCVSVKSVSTKGAPSDPPGTTPDAGPCVSPPSSSERGCTMHSTGSHAPAPAIVALLAFVLARRRSRDRSRELDVSSYR